MTKIAAYFLSAACATLLVVANAGAQVAVPLGTASTYAVLANSTVTNTGSSVISGNVGVSPGAAVTGFPPGTVAPPSAIHSADGSAGTAQSDVAIAYDYLAGLPVTVDLTGQDLGGLTPTPGVYKFDTSAQLTGTLTLDAHGSSNAVWVFQIGSTLTTASGSSVQLIDGAQPGNVFWQVGSSATLGTSTAFEGNILALMSITLNTGATMVGQALALNGAVTLDTNTITIPGSITVVKNTSGGDGTFTFTSNFGLTSLTTAGSTASQTFSGLAPGAAYSATETVPVGWTQTSNGCAAITVAAGETTTCTILNTAVALPLTGSITVVKNTVGGNGAFAFTSNFGLTSLTTVGNTASQTFSGLAPGAGYSATETVPAGWTQTSNGCAAITVAAGVTTTCTITNTQQGSITIVKNTVGGNGAFAFTSNFGLTSLTTSGGTASQTFGNLTPGGGYSVSETVPSGWTQSGATCTSGTPAAIVVAAGATTTCTITNTQQGSITIVKNTLGGNGAFAFTSNFGLTSLTTSGGTASQTFGNLTPGGGYSVSETVPSGWTQTTATCTSGTPAAIVVAAGATTTCVITNTQGTPPVGLITIVKNAVGGNGTFAFTSNFGLTSLTTAGGTASQTFSGLTPGAAYSVSETVPSGWTQTSATCTNGTPAAIVVVAGATTTCTITNTQAASPVGLITVVKNAVGGNGTFAFTSNFGLTSLTTAGGTASQTFSGLTPGAAYSVSETVPSGWTQTSATCTNGTPAAIVVVAGATTTCVINNTHGASAVGAITIVKNAVGGDGTFAFTSTFGLTSLTTSGGTATQTFTGLATSTYGLTETAQPGWTQTGASCTNGTPAFIYVNAGETTTCTITNTIAAPDLIIAKSHAGDFHQGDIGDAYTLTVTNAGQGPTTGVVTVTDALPAGLTATAIGGAGWSCTLTPLTCTRSDALAAAGVYPVITVTVNVANNGMAFGPAAGSPAFQTGDIMLSMSNGFVQWRRHDWTLVKVIRSAYEFFDTSDAGQAKGMAFDGSGRFFVTHWYGTQLLGGGDYGNDVVWFDRHGNGSTFFGSGYNCNPSSISFDATGNAYVGHADCSTQVLKFDASGNPLAQYSVAVENRGSEHVVLDPNQCTLYYTSEGGDVKQFDVCSNTQMPNFNVAPLPDAVEGGQQFSLLPGGGMLVADFSVIAMLGPSGNLVTTYGASPGHCWLGMALDPDGASFWASDWCSSVVTRFDMATGNVIETHLADGQGFTIKQICIPKNIFNTSVTNTAAVAGGGELNTSNDTASDVTNIDLPAPSTPAAGVVNAASYAPTVAAGSIASVFGSGLSSGQAIASVTPLPTTLESSSFQIGGQAAPLLSVSLSQVNMQVPWELAGQSQAMVTGTLGAPIPNPQLMSIAPFAPGIFTLNGAGSSMAPFAPALFVLNDTNPSQALVTIAGAQGFGPPSGGVGTPVAPGALISIYCTGLGAVSNQPATGAAAQANPLSVTTTTPTVTIGGIAAPVSFSGLAPGAVGLYQVTVQVPVGAPAGVAVPIVLTIGGVVSNTVTIAVQ